MKKVEAKEALKYAFSYEMLKIYGTLLVADVSLYLGLSFITNWAAVGGTSGLIGRFLGGMLLAAGLLSGLGGLVGFVYKLIADASNRE